MADASKSSFKLILGSKSIARRKILAEMGYQFSVVTADIDEKSIRKDKPEDLVTALAEAKADAIMEKLQTTVYKGVLQEKPTSEREAREFIEGYSGSHCTVIGSVLVTNIATGVRKGAWERAEVYFHEIPNEIIDSLIEEAVPYNVAGGLMVEHPLISRFVESLVGHMDTVMGLPKALTEKLILEALQPLH